MCFLVLNKNIIDEFVIYIVVTYFVIEYYIMETYLKYFNFLCSEQTDFSVATVK